MNENMATLREWIFQSNRIVFFGGAGVSTESGIPDFRGAYGLYSGANGKSYEEMLSIDYFLMHPDEFWHFYRSVLLHPEAKPNGAHQALAKLETQGKLSAVITQNIDGLHQMAGSKTVLELHGTELMNHCLQCHKKYTLQQVMAMTGTPHCSCGGVLRPDVIMYGESLDDYLLDEAINYIESSDLLIVGGTSLVVQPAASLVSYRGRKTKLCLINRDQTPYDKVAGLIIRDNIAEVLKSVVD